MSLEHAYIWLASFIAEVNQTLLEPLAKIARSYLKRIKMQGGETRYPQFLISSMESSKDQWKSDNDLLRELYPKDCIGYAIYHDNNELLQDLLQRKKTKKATGLEISYLEELILICHQLHFLEKGAH